MRGVSDGVSMLSAQAYSPYGEPMFTDLPTDFGFTGEMTDSANDLVYLRARVMNPRLGIFGSLDPFEGKTCSPMTLNGYGWVEGNTPNLADPTGRSSCQAPSKNLSPAKTSLATSVTDEFWKLAQSLFGTKGDAEFSMISTNSQCMGSANPMKGMFCNENGGGAGGAAALLFLLVAAGVITISTAKAATDALEAFNEFGDLLVPAPDVSMNTLPLEIESDIGIMEFARPSGPKMTWSSPYQALRDVSGVCAGCTFMSIINPQFCVVHRAAEQHYCAGHHVHIFKFNQGPNCFCNINQHGNPICLSNPYSGPEGGPHFPIGGIPSANPELALCSGGWMVQ